jgi:hypothetical protein
VSRRSVGIELGTIWKEAVVTYSRYYLGICLEELSKTTRLPVYVAYVPAELESESSRYASSFGGNCNGLGNPWDRSLYPSLADLLGTVYTVGSRTRGGGGEAHASLAV